jgi:hypothetical protein
MLRPAAMRGMQGTLIGWVERSAACCARCTVKISLRLRRIRLGRLERDFANNAIDLNLQPPFLGRFYRRHCFHSDGIEAASCNRLGHARQLAPDRLLRPMYSDYIGGKGSVRRMLRRLADAVCNSARCLAGLWPSETGDSGVFNIDQRLNLCRCTVRWYYGLKRVPRARLSHSDIDVRQQDRWTCY